MNPLMVLVLYALIVLMPLTEEIASCWWNGRKWGRSLVAFRLRVPGNLVPDDVARWAAAVGAATHSSKWGRGGLPPVALEVHATPYGIAHYLLIPPGTEEAFLGGLRAAMPGIRIDPAPDYVPAVPTVAGEWKMTSKRRPLAVDRTGDVTAMLLSSLLPLWSGESARVQVVLKSYGTPGPLSDNRTVSGRNWWMEDHAPADADVTRAERIKHRDPLLQVCARIGVTSPVEGRAMTLFGRTWGTLHGLNLPGVELKRRYIPSSVVAPRMHGRELPAWHIWPLLLNAREIVGMLGVPLRGMSLPGVTVGTARQLAPHPSIPSTGLVVARSNYGGADGRPLALRTIDRLRHVYLLGPTGTGKSTLLANMVLQDIYAGHGVIVLDPKSDLIGEILSRIPAHRGDDVIVMDPSATDYPVGFNLIGNVQDEAGRELVTDHVVHVMSALWRSSWGPRTSDVLRSSILTLTHARPADGTAFTLAEIPHLLENSTFRRAVTEQAGIPESVRGFWAAYERMSDAERAAVVGPAMNKIRALVSRTPLRLMLGQSRSGVDLPEVFRSGRILLVPLCKGVIGTDTAQLLGALLVASIWQATLARAAVPAERRRPMFVTLDEFQDVLRLPVDLSDMLAQARGLGVGLTLAHQILGQLPEEVRAAVLGTAQSHVVFSLGYDDARTMARRFAPLTDADLMGLGAHEVAARLCVDGQTLTPATGSTAALWRPETDPGALAQHSRTRYGTARHEVENALRARLGAADALGEPLGRAPIEQNGEPNVDTRNNTSNGTSDSTNSGLGRDTVEGDQ